VPSERKTQHQSFRGNHDDKVNSVATNGLVRYCASSIGVDHRPKKLSQSGIADLSAEILLNPEEVPRSIPRFKQIEGYGLSIVFYGAAGEELPGGVEWSNPQNIVGDHPTSTEKR
jgi:hypothetical protein